MNGIRDWFHREPVLGSQVVAMLTSTLTAIGLSVFKVDLTEEITLGVYVILSVLGAKVAREKVDGPETVATKDFQYIEKDNHVGDLLIENDRAKTLLLKAVLDPGERQDIRKEINTFLGRQ